MRKGENQKEVHSVTATEVKVSKHKSLLRSAATAWYKIISPAKALTAGLLSVSVLTSVIIMIIMLVTLYMNETDTYADYNNNIYGESLTFDHEGNLIMTTHDRKATAAVTYQTIGFVIKRYDMPMYAEYQQYVIIPVGDDVRYVDDDNDSSYVYCIYRTDESYIASAIATVSENWLLQLYEYGEYVYIDEIMTVAENGILQGGLNAGSPYGEVYFDYDGISSARAWAARESLKTHFDKQVYFSPHQEPKKFKYDYSVDSHNVLSNHVNNKISILSGTRYVADYDVTKAVPTGAGLCINGYADTVQYDITMDKICIDFYIPVRLEVNYTLVWRRYDNTLAEEQKKVTKWYYVKKSVSYYDISAVDIRYLTSLSVENYAFEHNKTEEVIDGCRPQISRNIYGEYYHHVTFPKYSDVYYIEGVTIADTGKKGVKPSIPDEDFQKIADAKIGAVQVRNDGLAVNNKVISDDSMYETSTPKPMAQNISVRKNICFSGYIIPDTKCNSRDNQTVGGYVYTDYDSGKTELYLVSGIESTTIHTPVYINGGTINNIVDNREQILNFDDNSVDKVFIDNEFNLYPDNYGEHINAKGYRLRDYRDMTGKQEVRFSCDVIADGQLMVKDTWIPFTRRTVFKLPQGTSPGAYDMIIRVYARNYTALTDNMEGHIEKTANLDIGNYAAEAVGSITAEYLLTKPSGNVVGTH